VLAQNIRNFLADRDPRDPTFAEIGNAIMRGDYGQATKWFLDRMYGALILSGFTGSFGNYYDLIDQWRSGKAGGRVKDPMHPPLWGVIEPFLNLAQGWIGEGGALPSGRLFDQFLQGISSAYRTAKPMVLNTTNASGIDIPGITDIAKAEHARNQLAFVRSRVGMFQDQNPVFKEKKQLRGTRAISMAGRGEFDPIRDRIQEGLLTGNTQAVTDAIRDWSERFPPDQLPKVLQDIKSSIQTSAPVKPGGSYSLASTMQVLAWARENLPEGEARRIFALVETYAKTAKKTGLFEKSKTLDSLARLDFDRFRAPQVAATKAQDITKARTQMAEIIRRGNIERALQAAE
jgi:hypothetical protein